MSYEKAIATGYRPNVTRLRPREWSIAEPSALPVSYGELVDHLRISDHDDQAAIERLVVAAAQYITKHTQQATTQAQVTARYPCFSRWMLLPVSNSPTDVVVTGDAVVASSVYRVVEDRPPLLELIEGESWPDLADSSMWAPVTVTYSAGVTDASLVSHEMRLAIAMLAGHWFDLGREPVVEASLSEMPMGLQVLIQSLRIEVRV